MNHQINTKNEKVLLFSNVLPFVIIFEFWSSTSVWVHLYLYLCSYINQFFHKFSMIIKDKNKIDITIKEIAKFKTRIQKQSNQFLINTKFAVELTIIPLKSHIHKSMRSELKIMTDILNKSTKASSNYSNYLLNQNRTRLYYVCRCLLRSINWFLKWIEIVAIRRVLLLYLSNHHQTNHHQK